MRNLSLLVLLLLCTPAVTAQVLDGKILAGAESAWQDAPAAKAATEDCIGGFAGVFPCENIALLAHMDRAALGTGTFGLNDIWGWEDPTSGRRYVLQGLENATAFVDITDPGSPVLLGHLPYTSGARPSVWRDIKVYDDHAFIVADGAGAHGMQVFDLTELRGVTGASPVVFSAVTRYEGFGSAHNIVINEDTGFAYAVGSSRGECDAGLHMIDIRDPRRPLFAGCFRDARTRRGYTHDAQCVTYTGPHISFQGREVCFSSNEDAVSIADVTDKSAPIPLGVATYPTSRYVHQGWLSEDHRFFYQNDELDERSLGSTTRTLIWDVSNLEDPQLASEYVHETASIDHNLYVSDGLLYEANYTAGLRVLDIADPDDPVEVAHFDTTPGDDGASFGGTWSVYPFFTDGTVALSSRGEGLFLVRLTGVLVSRLASFTVASGEDRVSFEWVMRRQSGIERFEVRRLRIDGGFDVLASTPAGTDSMQPRAFSLQVDDVPPGRSIVRLVGVTATGEARQFAEEEVFVVPGTHVVAEAYPNPASDTARLSLLVANAQDVVVEVYDDAGRLVSTLHDGYLEPGQELVLTARVASWRSGRYWVRYRGVTFAETALMLVVH